MNKKERWYIARFSLALANFGRRRPACTLFWKNWAVLLSLSQKKERRSLMLWKLESANSLQPVSAHGTPLLGRKMSRPVSQCSTDSNFSSISGVIYGHHHRHYPHNHRKMANNKRDLHHKMPQNRRKTQQQIKDHKIYSTFKPPVTPEENNGE